MGVRMKSENILMQLKDGREFTKREQMQLVFLLSVPAILSQITSIVMQYIDASMVGSLGAEASASIGLVSSSTWLFSGVCGAAAFPSRRRSTSGAERLRRQEVSCDSPCS